MNSGISAFFLRAAASVLAITAVLDVQAGQLPASPETGRAVAADAADGRHEIVFIDPVAGHERLLAAVPPSLEVVVLDRSRDGVQQIADALAGRSDIDAIHVLGHGGRGFMELGGGRLSQQSLAADAAALASWGDALAAHGDILLYGCDVASGGTGPAFVDALARATGADVAASTNRTGAAQRGGDWELELARGDIEPGNGLASVDFGGFDGVLQAAPVISGVGGTTSASEQLGVKIAPALTLSDADSITLVSASVSITGGFQSDQDHLLFANQNGISGSFNATTGVLSLTGSASVANYQTALRAVSYANPSDQPNTSNRTVSFIASDGTNSSAAATQTVTITPVNDEPTTSAANGYVNTGATVATSGLVTITDLMLDEGDPDDSGTGVTYTVSTATVSGTLFLDGNANGTVDGGESRTASSTFTQANIDNGLIRYRHGGGTGTADSFIFTVTDASGFGVAGLTFPFTIANRPVLVIGSGTPAHIEDGGATVIAPDLTVSDDDSTMLSGATVTLNDFVSGDTLEFADQNGIIGSFNAGTGVLTLTGSASLANYQAGLRSVAYSTTSSNPATGAGNGDRSIGFVVNDGSVSSVSQNATITVANANDAPVLDATQSPALAGTSEEAPAPTNGSTAGSTLVSALLGGITDVDTGALQGIAITGSTAQATLWYSLDGGTTWTVAGSMTGSNALLLQPDARLYLQPSANVSGTIANALTMRAWDRTGGSNGSSADTTTNGGGTAFSLASDSVAVAITAVNDAPVIDAGTVALTTVDEDSTSAGAALSTILAALNLADPDAGSPSGAAIVSSIGTGSWQYSTDGSSWHGIGAVSAGAALLLDASAQVRYVADQANGETASLEIRAWDRSSGVATAEATRSTSDVSVNGGSTAFSAQIATVSISVTAVNDAPTITNGATITLSGTSEDSASAAGMVSGMLTSVGRADVDSGALDGVAAIGSSGNGTWQYSIGGSSWTDFPVVSASAALLLTGPTQVRFQPDGDNGGTAVLTFRAWDQTSGTGSLAGAPQTADTGSNGGDTAFSTATASLSVTVTAVNDAPVLSAGAGTTTFSGGAGSAKTPVAIAPTLTLADVDDGESFSSATAQITGNYVNGADVLAFVNDDPATFGNLTASFSADTGSLTLSSAGGLATLSQMQAALQAITFANTADAPSTADRSISIIVNDGDADSNVVARTVLVEASNDPPAITAPASIAVTEDVATTLTGLVFSDPDAAAGPVSVTLTVDAGTLSAAPGAGVTVAGAGSATLTLGGSIAALDTFVTTGAVTYLTAPNATTDATLSITLDDAGNSGAGGPQTATASVMLIVTASNDAPVLAIGAAPATFLGGVDAAKTPVAIAPDLTLADADIGDRPVAGTVSIVGHVDGRGDVLALVSDAAFGDIVGVWDSASGVLTLTSPGNTAMPAQWQAALRAVTFGNGSDTLDTSARNIDFVISDGDANSNVVTPTVSVERTLRVTPVATGNGTITPSIARGVVSGASTTFSVVPASGFSASVGGTCGGTLAGSTYTTSVITADCTVQASFTQITHAVTPSAGANGTISPATVQTIARGATATFTVTPDAGYSASVAGSCGGTLAGTLYTTDAITGDCTVQAGFVRDPVVPGAPTAVTATAGDGTLFVSWGAPADDGGSAVIGYAVTTSPGGAGCIATGAPPATSCTVSGLTNGVAYQIAVTAQNSVGAGPAGLAAATSTPAGAPGAPTAVTAVIDGNTATVSWAAPTNSGGVPLASYTVTATPGGASCIVNGNPPPTVCVLSGLQAGVAYTFTVVATNAAGTAGAGGSGAPGSSSRPPQVIPTGSPWMLAVLALLTAWMAGRALAATRR